MTDGKDGSASDAAYITAYDKFKDSDTVDISLVLGSGSSSTVATHIINNIAEHRKDCVAVISPERADVVNNNSYSGKEAQDIIAFRDGLLHRLMQSWTLAGSISTISTTMSIAMC